MQGALKYGFYLSLYLHTHTHTHTYTYTYIYRFMMQGALKYGFYEFFKDSLAQNNPKAEGGKLPVPQVSFDTVLGLF
jgi:hypothetical protein